MLFQRIRHFTIESFVVSFYEFDTLLFETISYWFSKRTIKLAFQKVPPNDQITYVALPNSKCEIRHNRLYHSIIPRIFQYGSDGVRALLSGFSNLEILISSSEFLIRRLGLAYRGLRRFIMAIRFYFRRDYSSSSRRKRMAE